MWSLPRPGFPLLDVSTYMLINERCVRSAHLNRVKKSEAINANDERFSFRFFLYRARFSEARLKD